MTTPSLVGGMARGAFSKGGIGSAAVAVVLALAGMTASASAAAISPNEQQCLACHGVPGLEKPLVDGGTLSLHIAPASFAQSVHNTIGCTACHTDIDRTTHPATVRPIANKREFSIAMAQVCRNCHSQQFQQWGQSVHAALVRDGNPIAPVCTGCHSPHAVMKGAAAMMDTVPCKTCHGAIFTAYASSVHGIMRSQGLTAAPLCFGCHGAHEVAVPSAGAGRRDVCLGCHTEAVASHRTWLPNVDLHFSVVACPVCHAPKAERMVDLVLYNSATLKETPRPVGIPEFETLSSSQTAGKPGLDPTTLLALLKAADGPGVAGKTSIRGRLEVRTGVQDHELTDASQAIGTCATCHQQGAKTFQSVVVSVAGPAGIPIHYDATTDVLRSAFTVDSVGGFYAIGGTRVTFLDVLLVLALAGGIGGPIGHMLWRWTFRRILNRKAHEQSKG
ncbi:MAG TPA: hypothetical protein VMU82_00370 [Acetobacteraceae bacterium]|nr:hypothetical protein [Acetobacteraceae bacterium]